MTPAPAAVILAAGDGRRMGMPKIRLEIAGRPFLARIAATLAAAGIGDTICVVRPADEAFAGGLGLALRITVNGRPEAGMLSSLRRGLALAPPGSPILVWPVDHPLVQPQTIAALAAAARRWPAAVIKPRFAGAGGHPLVIPWSLAERTMAAGDEARLDELIRAGGEMQQAVDVADEGVVRNINRRFEFEGMSAPGLT